MKKTKNVDMSKDLNDNSEKQKSKSFFIYYVDLFFEFIYNSFFEGLLGFFLSSYSKLENALKKGFFYNIFAKNKRIRAFFRKIRMFFSKSFAESFIIKKLGDFICILTSIPLKSYGNFSFSFGIYSVLIYFINLLISKSSETDTQKLYVGIVLCVISIPLLLSSKSLAQAIYNGRITNFIFVKFFGFKEETFQAKQKTLKHHSNIMIFTGMLFGLLTIVFQPLLIIAFILSFAIFSLIICVPEVGILSALFLLPFFSLLNSPTIAIALLIIVTAFSTIIKAIQGKRILKIKLIDILVMIFSAILFLSGTISVGGKNSFYSALICCTLIIGYFLVVTLMRSFLWLERCILALTTSSVFVSIIGIIQYALGELETTTFDNNYFSDIQGRVVSLFENSNVLGNYLAMIFPFLLAIFIFTKEKNTKLFWAISILLTTGCAILTWSRSAWVAILISTFVFIFIFTRKVGRLIPLGILLVPYLSFVLPGAIINRFLSIGDIADSSTMYRIYTWKGTFSAIKEYFLGGIGFGEDAFKSIYPAFSYAGIEGAEHSHNLLLQILLATGIMGAIFFGLIVFLNISQNLEYTKNKSVDENSKLFLVAAFTSFIAAITMGLFDYIWFNYRIFFLFWIVIAISSAYYRVKENEDARKEIEADYVSSSADTEILL